MPTPEQEAAEQTLRMNCLEIAARVALAEGYGGNTDGESIINLAIDIYNFIHDNKAPGQ